eukprot:14400-Heterococcus_DN1.PRE.1
MPVFVQDSQATREVSSSRRQASSTASETWSQILSGWPSFTLSEVNRKCPAAGGPGAFVCAMLAACLWKELLQKCVRDVRLKITKSDACREARLQELDPLARRVFAIYQQSETVSANCFQRSCARGVASLDCSITEC